MFDINVRDQSRSAEAKAESRYRRFITKNKRRKVDLDLDAILSDMNRERNWVR